MKLLTTFLCSLILLGLGHNTVARTSGRNLSKTKNKKEQAFDHYNLTIDVSVSAGTALATSGYDLTIFKGFDPGDGNVNYDTAWYVVNNTGLVPGLISLNWTAFIKAAFVTEVEENNVILRQGTKSSEKFVEGQFVAFNKTGWSGPFNNVSSSNFAIQYGVPNNPMHLTLLSPVLGSKNTEEWNPFFYDESVMAEGSIFSGSTTAYLKVQLTRNVQAGTFTGLASKKTKTIDFGDKNTAAICIFMTDSLEPSLKIGTGLCDTPCGGVEMA